MISTNDQESLFRLISDYLEQDVECLAIGGTAMMFHGYKNTTKDIDLVFKTEKERNAFIRAIEKLGYRQKALKPTYDDLRAKGKGKPMLYSRGEERFDLFATNVFGFSINFGNFVERHDFIGNKELSIFTAPKELLILLKSVTNRERDYEDIETIVKTEQDIDWRSIIDEAIKQRQQTPWILIDLEEKMQALRKRTFIKSEHFERIYLAEKQAKK